MPVAAVILLGVVTDYAIFLLSGYRARLAAGDDRLRAAERSAGRYAPIVVTAGLIVAAETAALFVGRLDFFRAFGPGMALAALIGTLAAIILVPALLAMFGRAAFFPAGLGGPRAAPRAEGVERRSPARVGLAHRATARPVAALVILVTGAALVTERPRLVRLEEMLARQPGVTGVLGPREEPGNLLEGAAVAADSADAIDTVRRLERRMPSLLASAGLKGATMGFAGQTALAAETISTTLGDLWRIALAALGVNLVLLVVLLRSLVAPIFLLGASVLALAATLGLTTFFFESLLGWDELTYYVPFAAAVLLVSLGSDNNVFVVGQVWDEAGRRPLRQAVAIAVPRASRAITVAGVALAGSAFRALASALAVGVLLDAFVVRSLLVPADLVPRRAGGPAAGCGRGGAVGRSAHRAREGPEEGRRYSDAASRLTRFPVASTP